MVSHMKIVVVDDIIFALNGVFFDEIALTRYIPSPHPWDCLTLQTA